MCHTWMETTSPDRQRGLSGPEVTLMLMGAWPVDGTGAWGCRVSKQPWLLTCSVGKKGDCVKNWSHAPISLSSLRPTYMYMGGQLSHLHAHTCPIHHLHTSHITPSHILLHPHYTFTHPILHLHTSRITPSHILGILHLHTSLSYPPSHFLL